MKGTWKKLETDELELDEKVINTVAKQIQEASSVLKYSLYLPQIGMDIEIEKIFTFQFIEDINNTIYENLGSFIGNNKYDIFGYNGKYQNKKSDFSCLVCYNKFWQHVFKQHAILSAYDKLRRIIGQAVPLSNYNFYKYANYTNDLEEMFDNCHHGLDYLLGLDNNDSKITDFDMFNIKKENKIKSCKDRIDQYSPNFNRQIKTLNKKLNSINLLMLLKQTQEQSYAARLDLLEFYQFSVLRKSKNPDNNFEILNILNIHKKNHITYNDYKQYIKSVGRMFDIIKNNKARHKLSLSDRIYLSYKIEKLLSPVTIDCLYQNIFNIEEVSPLKNDYNYMVNSCLQLPNVFTRQYILQIAIDTIGKHFNENFTDKYFFPNITENLESVMSSFEKKNFIDDQRKFYLLVNRYKDFIDYMTLIVFPLYENYFFCTLWNSISKFCDNNVSTLVSFYKILGTYLNDAENVKKMFSTKNILMDYGINYDTIIKTNFIKNKDKFDIFNDLDTKLYYRCLKTLENNINNNNTYDFIDFNYISGNYFNNEPEQEKRESKFKKYARVNIIKNIIDK